MFTCKTGDLLVRLLTSTYLETALDKANEVLVLDEAEDGPLNETLCIAQLSVDLLCNNKKNIYAITLLWLSLDTRSLDSKHLLSVTDTLNLCSFAKQNYLQKLSTC